MSRSTQQLRGIDRSLPPLSDGEQMVYFQAGGQWCYLRTPKNYKADRDSGRAVPCVIRCRGIADYVFVREGTYQRFGSVEWENQAVRRTEIDELVESGMVVAGSELTGDHWGRPAAVAANCALLNSLIDKVNIDPNQVGLMTGGGMGGTVVWNSAIGPLAGRVRAVVFIQGVVSLPSMMHHRLWPNLLEAYGLPADTPDDVAVACLEANNPITQTQLLLKAKGKTYAKSLPIALFLHGEKDPDVPYEENPVALSNLLKQYGIDFNLRTYWGRGHDLHTLGRPLAQEIREHFQRCFSS
jgi:hypothetical protein